jgi:hypothetical protein
MTVKKVPTTAERIQMTAGKVPITAKRNEMNAEGIRITAAAWNCWFWRK